MSADKVRYYNKIDMGIFLFMLEICLEHENYTYERTLFADTTDDILLCLMRDTRKANVNLISVRFVS